MPLTEPNPLGATDPAGAHRTESTEIAPIYVSLPAIVVLGAEAKQEIHTRVALPAYRTAPGPAANFPENRFMRGFPERGLWDTRSSEHREQSLQTPGEPCSQFRNS